MYSSGEIAPESAGLPPPIYTGWWPMDPADRGLGASRLPPARRRTVDVPAGTGGRPAGPDCGLATSAHSRGHGAGPRRRPRLLRPRGRQLVGHGLQARRTTPERILEAAAHRHFLLHRNLVRSSLDDITLGVRSPIEHDYLHKVEQAHDLPEGRRQAGRRHTEVDVLYEEFGLIVELMAGAATPGWAGSGTSGGTPAPPLTA